MEKSVHKKLNELQSTAISGNDISSSCLYVLALTVMYAGQFAWISNSGIIGGGRYAEPNHHYFGFNFGFRSIFQTFQEIFRQVKQIFTAFKPQYLFAGVRVFYKKR